MATPSTSPVQVRYIYALAGAARLVSLKIVLLDPGPPVRICCPPFVSVRSIYILSVNKQSTPGRAQFGGGAGRGWELVPAPGPRPYELGLGQRARPAGRPVPHSSLCNTTSVQNQWSHPKSPSLPGINRSKSHARGQKHCLWGCAGLWRVLWGRSQRPLPSPGRYLAAEGAVLSKTNCPTSAGLAPPGHRMARERLQSAPPAGTQAVGRCQLLFMYRVSVGFFRWADFGFLVRWSWFEPKAAYTHLLTQRKCRLLTF